MVVFTIAVVVETNQPRSTKRQSRQDSTSVRQPVDLKRVLADLARWADLRHSRRNERPNRQPADGHLVLGSECSRKTDLVEQSWSLSSGESSQEGPCDGSRF